MSETQTVTIADFLLARIAEDEAVARAATPGPWYWEPKSTEEWPTGDQSLRSRYRPDGQDYDSNVLRGWGYDASGIDAEDGDREHVARHDPARVLADVEAKRRIVEAFTEDPWCVDGGYVYTDFALRMLALPFAGHPDYRPEWKP